MYPCTPAHLGALCGDGLESSLGGGSGSGGFSGDLGGGGGGSSGVLEGVDVVGLQIGGLGCSRVGV